MADTSIHVHETVERVPLTHLTPAPWNPRMIRDARFKNLCRSIELDPGFLDQRPILATADGTIYAGNMRYRAVAHLGWRDVPALLVDIPDQLAKERSLRDNAQWGEWQDQGLAELLYGLQQQDSALDLLGFEDDEIKRLLDSVGGLGETADDPGAQLNRASELQEKWGCKVGQVWELGNHRLAVGDCTDARVVSALMRGETAGAVVTDPPYGIDQPGIENDTPSGLSVLFLGCLRAMPVKDAAIIAFQSTRMFPVWLDAIRAAGHDFERMLWMYKPNDVTFPWRGWLLTSEAILVSTVGEAAWLRVDPFAHDCYTSNWDSETKSKIDGWHASIKPLPLVQDLVARVGGMVYEPFSGSGTTIIACERLGRMCRAVELTAGYAAISIQRWADATGLEPRLSDG